MSDEHWAAPIPGLARCYPLLDSPRCTGKGYPPAEGGAGSVWTPRRLPYARGPPSRVVRRPCYNKPVMRVPPRIAARRGRMVSAGLAMLALALALTQPAAAPVRSVLRPAEHCGLGPATTSPPIRGPRWHAMGAALPGVPPDRGRRTLPSPQAGSPPSRRQHGDQHHANPAAAAMAALRAFAHGFSAGRYGAMWAWLAPAAHTGWGGPARFSAE